MLGNLSGMHLIAILAVVLLIFGAPKLPALARSLGQSMRILKQEVSAETDDAPNASGTERAEAQAASAAQVVPDAQVAAPAAEIPEAPAKA